MPSNFLRYFFNIREFVVERGCRDIFEHFIVKCNNDISINFGDVICNRLHYLFATQLF